MCEIRLAKTDAEKEAVFRFRYKIYVKEMGLKETYANHGKKRLSDPLDATGHIFVAFKGNEIIGTARINYRRDSDDLFGYVELYDIDDRYFPSTYTSVSTKMMISPEHRSSILAYRLASALYEHGMRDGIRYDFCDCSFSLCDFYRRLGYVVHKPLIKHPDHGPMTVMRLNALDQEHLKKISSPFLRTIRR